MLHAALFAIATGSAHASEHTTWHWPEGEHRRYYLESHGVVLNFLPLYAPRNHITRFSRYEVALVADCAASNKRIGRQQDVRCDIEDVALRISPMARDAHQAGPTLTQLQALKEGLYVQATFKDNGTMVAFDLEGLPDKMERDRRVQQDLRLLVQRTFVGLQLARPTSDDWSKPWIEKSALITQPIGRRDAVSRLEHTPTVNAERGVVQITTSGTVTMRTSGGGANTQPSRERRVALPCGMHRRAPWWADSGSPTSPAPEWSIPMEMASDTTCPRPPPRPASSCASTARTSHRLWDRGPSSSIRAAPLPLCSRR